MKMKKKKSGFTLLELVVVIAILGILAAVLIPIIYGFVEQTRLVADQATVRNLNTVTPVYRLGTPNSDPFTVTSNSSDQLMQALVTGGYWPKVTSPQSKDTSFVWLFEQQVWRLLFSDSFYLISPADGLSNTRNGWLEGSYAGSAKDIVITRTLDGKLIMAIWQDVFSGKDLTAVTFADDSDITRIHARAFRNNQLNQIVFPDSLKRIDVWAFRNNNLTEITLPDGFETVEGQAFRDNNITKITVGSNLGFIGENAFGNNHIGFAEAYASGGAGTYRYIGGQWIKQ